MIPLAKLGESEPSRFPHARGVRFRNHQAIYRAICDGRMEGRIVGVELIERSVANPRVESFDQTVHAVLRLPIG